VRCDLILKPRARNLISDEPIFSTDGADIALPFDIPLLAAQKHLIMLKKSGPIFLE
jgi:hypothetical protein